MFEIPTVIEIDGEQLNITNKGDFRMVLDCFAALNDIDLDEKERVYCSLIIFYEDFNSVYDLAHFPHLKEAVQEMYKFFNCGDDKGVGNKMHHKVIDWEGDAQLVASAINKVAGQEIRSLEYLHWWTFMGYYLAIGESPLATIVGVRSKVAEGKKLEKHERKFMNDNPQYFTIDYRTLEEKEAEREIMELWESGG